ncbi:MAG: hypothetical protein ACK5N8_05455 [Alphaproteobacteria bacterium]
MLQLKKTFLYSLVLALLLCGNAKAGLYGVDSVNPYLPEETPQTTGFSPKHIANYRSLMRDNINFLSRYAKAKSPQFQIILHGDDTLFNIGEVEYLTSQYNNIKNKTMNNEKTSLLASENIDAISVVGVSCDNKEIPQIIKDKKQTPIYIEHCSNEKEIDRAIEFSIENNAPAYLFSNRENAFKNIKGELIIKENSRNIFTTKDAKNISFLLDDGQFASKYEMIEDMSKTNYDIIVIKPLFHNKTRFTKAEIESMKFKKNGAKRLIIAEMNLTEANPIDYFWQEDWQLGSPSWLKRKSFVEENSVITEYWQPQWREVLSKHFNSIMNSGFDGVWFTGTENYQYFEKQTPVI